VENEQFTVEELDHNKVVREPTAALIIAFLLLLIPLMILYAILRKWL
jgi:hypothetical protein